MFCFFFSSRRRHTRWPRDWSSDVCSSDLLAHHGESGYVEMIEHQARMGDLLRESLASAGWRIVNTTPLPLVCFTRDGLDTTKFLAALYRQQIAWMSEVRLGAGAPVLRACITSFRTSASDIDDVVRAMGRIVQ